MNNSYSYARNQKNLHRTLVGLIVVLSLMMGSLPAAQAQGGDAPELFSDAGAADVAPNNPAHVVRSRFVHVNFGLLFGPGGQALDTTSTPEITLNLFPDANYTGVVERVELNFSGGRSWTGKLKGKNGYFILVASESAFIAHVASPEGIYEVSLAGKNLYKVVQIDQSRLGEDAPGLVDQSTTTLLDENLDPAADAASPIDVMVIHTVNARVAEGGTAAMRARIDLAMSETKTSYLNAGVVPRLRLVHVEEVAYTESGNLDVDLTRLRNPSDGILDGMHAVRDIYGADMVAFIVNGDPAVLGCGLASAILANAATAFQVSVRDCMTGNYTFGHEFGHLQGARHDLFVDPTNTPYPVGHGYVNTTARWRTVMAYNDKCALTPPGTFCPRLLFFSNPTKLYSGAPTGVVGSSENYKVLNATAFAIANFRQRKIGTNFLANFHTTVGPWQGVVGTWALGHTPSVTYYTSAGAPGVYASAQVPSAYADLTYQARIWRKGCVNCANGLLIRGNPASLGPDKSWQPSYEFSFSNNGFFSVWKIFANGTFAALQDWTATGAIVQGSWNTLKVVAVGKSLQFYINNTLVYSATDPSFRIGRLGIEFYRDPTSTGNRIFVDWVKVVNTPTGGVAYDQAADVSGTPVRGGNRFMSP